MIARRLAVGLVATAFLAAVPSADADFIQVVSPTAAYQNTTTKLLITAPDFSSVASLSDAQLTVMFSPAVEARTVPTSWGTWSAPPNSESATPRVLYPGLNVISETLTLSQPVFEFGVEMEPSTLGIFPMTATFYNGGVIAGTIFQNVNGFKGARLFAALTHDQPFTKVVLDISSNSQGFGFTQVRYGNVPEPSSWVLLAFGVAAASLAYRRGRGSCTRPGPAP